MTLYNMLFGMNVKPTILCGLIVNNPFKNIPRFRDAEVYYDDNGKLILCILTRVGGNNREGYEEEIKFIRSLPNFIKDYDDEFDDTYAYFLYDVTEWKNDIEAFMSSNFDRLSDNFKTKLLNAWKDNDKVYTLLKQVIEK